MRRSTSRGASRPNATRAEPGAGGAGAPSLIRGYLAGMMIAIVPFLVMVVGLVLWLAGGPKTAPVGERMFTCGLLVTLFVLAHETVRLLR